MKSLSTLLTIGLLATGLVGCVTPGRSYDDSKVALIKKEATTEAELLEWFGPASSRTMAVDGGKMLAWRFAPARVGSTSSSGRLEVRLGADGKVVSYSASGGSK
jgi:hypothetical protein